MSIFKKNEKSEKIIISLLANRFFIEIHYSNSKNLISKANFIFHGKILLFRRQKMKF